MLKCSQCTNHSQRHRYDGGTERTWIRAASARFNPSSASDSNMKYVVTELNGCVENSVEHVVAQSVTRVAFLHLVWPPTIVFQHCLPAVSGEQQTARRHPDSAVMTHQQL